MEVQIIICRLQLLLLIFLLHRYECAKILAIFPLYARSHFNMFEPILKVLAERGHEVDVISPFPLKTKLPSYYSEYIQAAPEFYTAIARADSTFKSNGIGETGVIETRYNDLSLAGLFPSAVNNMSVEILYEFKNSNPLGKTIYMWNNFQYPTCERSFDSESIQNLYKNVDNVRYDLILMEVLACDCFLAFAHKLKDVPIVGFTTCLSYPWGIDRFGLPDNPAFTLNMFLTITPPYSFLERVYNTIAKTVSKLSYYYMQTLELNEMVRTKLGDHSIPPLYELEKRFSLLLTNTHFSIYGSYPVPPNVIDVGGVHMIFNPLPKHIEETLNNSKNGVILFSLGSILKIDTFSPEKQRALFEAFAELPYDIIWKGNNDKLVGPFPDNIHFEPWLPQRDILCHPKTKLFITHGGLLGTQEAVYCGVPMITMPFAFDQELHLKICSDLGIGAGLRYEDITKTKALETIRLVLNAPSYQKNIKHVSNIFRDRPMSPMDTAIYWIEYVIRHKGAHHLRPANIDLPWYQLYLLDVFLFFVLVVIILPLTIYLVLISKYRKFIKCKLLKKLKSQ